jgi:hypothetical protein
VKLTGLIFNRLLSIKLSVQASGIHCIVDITITCIETFSFGVSYLDLSVLVTRLQTVRDHVFPVSDSRTLVSLQSKMSRLKPLSRHDSNYAYLLHPFLNRS